MVKKRKVIILGAQGRDYHNFNVFFRDNSSYDVVAFTVAQIQMRNRIYPKILAGKLYPKGIPIFHEESLPKLIKDYDVDVVVLAYSDLSHEEVMQKASLVLSCGAEFRLMGPKETMLKSKKPVIAVTGASSAPNPENVICNKSIKELNPSFIGLRTPIKV
jgi:predicted GTPase